MKKIFIILLFIIAISPLYAGVRVAGKVTDIFLSDNILRFKVTDTITPLCVLNGDSFYKIKLDKDSTSKKYNTDFYFYYSLIVYAYKFQKDITLDLGSTPPEKDDFVPAKCGLDETDIWVNYMYVNF